MSEIPERPSAEELLDLMGRMIELLSVNTQRLSFVHEQLGDIDIRLANIEDTLASPPGDTLPESAPEEDMADCAVCKMCIAAGGMVQ